MVSPTRSRDISKGVCHCAGRLLVLPPCVLVGDIATGSNHLSISPGDLS